MIQETALDNAGLALQKRSRLIAALMALAAISAAVEIEAQYFGPRTSVYIFKPLTMTLIILIAGIAGVRGQNGYRNLIYFDPKTTVTCVSPFSESAFMKAERFLPSSSPTSEPPLTRPFCFTVFVVTFNPACLRLSS